MTRIFALAALTAASLSAPAMAQDAPDQRAQVVSYADLDLSSEAGRRALDRRIHVAVKEVCGTASDADVAGKNQVRRCLVDTHAQLSSVRGKALELAARPTQVASAAGGN